MSRLLKHKWCSVVLVCLLFTSGCASKNIESGSAPISESFTSSKLTNSEKSFSYLRVLRTNAVSVELLVASRKLVPAKANRPEIWLVGAIHIAESNYYNELQSHLDGMNLVLFEGVKMSTGNRSEIMNSKKRAKDQEGKNMTPGQVEMLPRIDRFPKEAEDSIQSKLAKSLGLVFQLQAIDYSRPNFENCDMNIVQLEKIFSREKTTAEETGSSGSEEWEKLKGLYLGNSLASVIADLILRIMGSSPRMSALMKIAFIETLCRLDGDFEKWEGLPGGMRELLKVLINERNSVIISRLKEVLPKMKKGSKVALFYGAAHMYDLERRICTELRYKPADERWFKAFGVDGQKYGISEIEINFVKNIVEMTIRQMKVKN